jgi:cytochrome c oxidase assembly protein subunit 15
MMSEGKYMHETVLIEKPTLFLNLVEGKSGIQFVHRNLAYVVVGLMLFLVYKSRKFILAASQKRGLNTLVIFVFMQFTLGVVTLLLHVPLWLGLAHQAMAFLLLASMVYTLHRLSK